MRLVLAGGTGFIGRALRESLTARGHEVVVLTRQSARENQPGVRTRYAGWNPPNGGPWERELDGVEGVINLAGEPIVGKRWTEHRKQKIVESRTGAARAIVTALRKARKKPSFLLNASAIGYYGSHGDETLVEESPAGRDFLAASCRAWEAEALKAEEAVVRVIRLRIGIVLEQGGGALGKMLPPFRLGLGGPLGSGRQWMSWIHRDDLIGLIHFAIEKKEVRGVLNATAPNPVTMKEFTTTLGRTLGRPALFPVPAFVLRILLGEMADVLLTGQRVLPKRALDHGYSFKFPELGKALKEILTR
ncbi:MAG: TIGR01777 family protein [Candidatus Omnitrophica bacterium]|nr:TIGR01777 family protein [Candidatus Omnitrophota bacterium]